MLLSFKIPKKKITEQIVHGIKTVTEAVLLHSFKADMITENQLSEGNFKLCSTLAWGKVWPMRRMKLICKCLKKYFGCMSITHKWLTNRSLSQMVVGS